VKVLLVDDADLNLKFVSRLLVKLGHEAVACQSGTDAMKLVEKKELPPVVLLDWMMPDVSGLDICRKIRETHAKQQVFIIMLTSRSLETDRLEAIEAGADIHLSKPPNLDQLAYAFEVAGKTLTV